MIREDLWLLINRILERGSIGKEFNKSLIILLPKGSNPRKVRDFRPISLLGGVYKIVAKVLANRIRLLIPKLVHPNQAGFVHGHSLAESCLSVWAGVEESHKQGDFILLKVDFEKAYDRLEWRFLIECLKAMNIGPNFIRWVGALMSEAKCSSSSQRGDDVGVSDF